MGLSFHFSHSFYRRGVPSGSVNWDSVKYVCPKYCVRLKKLQLPDQFNISTQYFNLLTLFGRRTLNTHCSQVN